MVDAQAFSKDSASAESRERGRNWRRGDHRRHDKSINKQDTGAGAIPFYNQRAIDVAGRPALRAAACRTVVAEERTVMRMLQTVIAAFVVLGATSAYGQTRAAAPSSCDLPHASGVSAQQLMSGQRPRTYRLFVPSDYDGHQRVPLVLDLHGSGGSSDGEARNSGFETLGASERFIVATLDAVDRRWNVPIQEGRPDDVAYVNDVIDHVGARVCIDEARVYATGFSGGARMSSLLGCKLGSRIAAIAPVSGLRYPGPCTGRQVPVLTFHGLADPQNPYDGHAAGRGEEWLESVPEALASWARHDGCKGDAILEDPPGPLSTMRYEGCEGGTEARLIRIDGLGHAWTRKEVDTTAVMWEFFKRHHLAGSAR
jgi:polyhydroxybutyrate depolymerase